MAVIEGTNTIAGVLGQPLRNAGAPSNGTSEVQTVTIEGGPTGGTFTLSFEGFTTAAIAYDAASSAVQTALRNLLTIGSAGVNVSGSAGGPYTVTFAGNLAKLNVPALGKNNAGLTGGSSPDVSITVATPGVTATFRDAATGAYLIDTTNGILYQNSSTTALQPAWEQIEGAAGVGTANIADGAVTAAKTNTTTPGTAEASKIAVLGTNKNLDVLALATLKLGAGAGVSVTATAAELNKLAGAGAIVASGTQAALISDPTGGATQDAEARAAINALIDAVQAFGLVASS